MLLDRQRIVGAALDRGIVGDDEDLAARDAADAGDEPGGRRLVVVDIPRRKRRELEKRRVGIEQLLDAFAHRQLALRAMPLEVLAARRPGARRARRSPQLADEPLHPRAVRAEGLGGRVDVRGEGVHGNAEC